MHVFSSTTIVLSYAVEAAFYLASALLMISLLSFGPAVLCVALLFTGFGCQRVVQVVFSWSQLTRPHLWRWEHWSLKPPKWLYDLVPQRVTKDRDGGEL